MFVINKLIWARHAFLESNKNMEMLIQIEKCVTSWTTCWTRTARKIIWNSQGWRRDEPCVFVPDVVISKNLRWAAILWGKSGQKGNNKQVINNKVLKGCVMTSTSAGCEYNALGEKKKSPKCGNTEKNKELIDGFTCGHAAKPIS